MTGAGSAFALDRIGQILVPITDVDRAVEFYRDVLGMTFVFRFPGMAFFMCGDVRLYLAGPEDPSFAGRSTIYYRVPDIDAGVAELEARGITFDDRPHRIFDDGTNELWLAFFRDPDGNNLALMSEVPSRVR